MVGSKKSFSNKIENLRNLTVNSVEGDCEINYGVTENQNHGVFLVSLRLQTTVNRQQSISCLMCLFRTTDNGQRTTSFAELRSYGESESRTFSYFFKTTDYGLRASRNHGITENRNHGVFF